MNELVLTKTGTRIGPDVVDEEAEESPWRFRGNR